MSKTQKGIKAKIIVFFSFIKRKCSAFWTWYKHFFVGRPWYQKLWAGFLSFLAFIVVYVLAVMFNLFWLFGYSPSVGEIMHPKTAKASEVYSADGKLLGRYFNENRSPVPYDSINPMFFKTLIDTEDERFYKHHGVDFKGIFAAAKDAAHGRARGASTITQQLVKNMFKLREEKKGGFFKDIENKGLLGFVPGVKMFLMKTKEMVIAIELELFYDKKDILTMYANTVDFGSNAYGIKTAAKTYFDTTPMKLKTEEAAVLVGLLKATSAYNPNINPKNSRRRRDVVLDNLQSHKDLTAEECDSLKELPIDLKFHVENAYEGDALYFRQAVADYLKEKMPDIDPYTDGLKIYTTLDSRMQKYAEEAVAQQMKVVQGNFKNHWGKNDPWIDEDGNVIPGFIEGVARKSELYKTLQARFPNSPDSIDEALNRPHTVKLFDYASPNKTKTEVMSSMDSIRYMVRFMHTGFVAMEPQTGEVKAWVGDIDFATWKYDKVSAMRQPGSTFKLFVYSAAMNAGLTPCDKRRDSYIQMNVYDPKKHETTVWRPTNANGRFSNDSIPLRAAFARSINSVAVKLGQEVGIPNVIQVAKSLGINSPLDNTPSLALGSSDVNLLEMVNAYAAIANNGRHVDPVLVTKILDSDGNTIYESSPETRQAVPERTAFLMQQMLEAGTHDGGGTSLSLGSYLNGNYNAIDYGGKTGTSNNHSDAWFVGVTPNLVGGAWVGGEYRCIHFRTGALGQGSKTALPIFGLFLQKVLADPQLHSKYAHKFGPAPDGVSSALYACGYAPTVVKKDSTTVVSDSLTLGDEDLDLTENPGEEGGEGATEKPAHSTAPAEHNAATAPATESTVAPTTEKKAKAKATKPAAAKPKKKKSNGIGEEVGM